MQEPGGAAEVEACVRAKYAELEEQERLLRKVLVQMHAQEEKAIRLQRHR